MTDLEQPSGASTAVDARRGSPREIATVFGLTIGIWLFLWVLKGSLINFDFGEGRLLRTLIAEAVMVAVLWPWLAARGWSFGTIAGVPEPRDVWRGFWLAVIAYACAVFSAYTWVVFVPGSYEAMRAATPIGTASPWVVLFGAVFNPVVEEFLWLGYGVTALGRYGTRTAAAVSIALRLTVHLYQGRVAFIGVLPLAVVFTLYFIRTNRLWPVIVAHVLFDAIALSTVVRH